MANPNKGDALLSDASGDALLGDRQSNVADLTIAYTTDDPGVTPNSAITFADGDGTLVTAEVVEAVEEIVAKVNAILDVLEAHGLMTAS